jgi:DNA replication protein DnaC
MSKKLCDTIFEAVCSNLGTNQPSFLLDGPDGTGKTLLYSTLLHTIQGKGDSVTSVASTGIAVSLSVSRRQNIQDSSVVGATSTCNFKPDTEEANALFH